MDKVEPSQPKKQSLPGKVFDKYYKELLIIPIIILLLSFGMILNHYRVTGEFFARDVSLKGGVTLTIHSDKQVDVKDLQSFLSQQLGQGDINVRLITQSGRQVGLIIDAAIQQQNDLDKLLGLVQQKMGTLQKSEYNIQSIGGALGQSFFKEAIVSVLIAFFCMSLVVLIYFRNFVPSLFVIWCAFNDIIMPFAVIVLLGVKLSSAGIGAFLMLIGYSIDTDILLTSRVLKGREGTVFERTMGAMKTGMTMSLTALASTTVGYIFSQSDTIKQIMLILSIGLVFDIINTWITNAGILRWYLERKKA